MKRKQKSIVESTAKSQVQPWDQLTIIPEHLRREVWEEYCKLQQRDAALHRERSLEELYAELLADGDFFRWRVLEKLSAVRNELIRIGGIRMPWESGGAHVG